jgi:hypothetical protein
MSQPLTFCLTVQLSSRGALSYHQWRATYGVNGRQLPTHQASGHDLDASYLGYLASAFVDEIVLARRGQDPIPDL